MSPSTDTLKSKQQNDQQKIHWKFGLKYSENVGVGHECYVLVCLFPL